MLPIHRDMLSTGCLGISTILPPRDVMPICASVGNERAILPFFFPLDQTALAWLIPYLPSFPVSQAHRLEDRLPLPSHSTSCARQATYSSPPKIVPADRDSHLPTYSGLAGLGDTNVLLVTGYTDPQAW